MIQDLHKDKKSSETSRDPRAAIAAETDRRSETRGGEGEEEEASGAAASGGSIKLRWRDGG